MSQENNIKLDIFAKNYALPDNRTITVWDITSPEDTKFYFQLRFEQNNNKINYNIIKNCLIASIENLPNIKKLVFNHKKKFFINLGLDIESTAIIQKKIKGQEKYSQALFKLDERKQSVIQVSDRELLDLFVLDTLDKNGKKYYLSYEIPKDITKDNTPLCSISIYNDKQLSEKIYLFPTNSLKNVFLKNSEPINLKDLNIPYVRNNDPYNQTETHNQYIQTQINLQTIISEILIHLEKQKYLREDGSKKIKIFRTISEAISKGETLDTIYNHHLNAHDSWKCLALHRDLWGFFSFFKGKTHSLVAWDALKKEISNFKDLSSQTFSI